MKYQKFALLLSVLIVAMFVLGACGTPQPVPTVVQVTVVVTATPGDAVACPEKCTVTEEPREACVNIDKGVWDCSKFGHTLIFSNVPETMTPYSYPIKPDVLAKLRPEVSKFSSLADSSIVVVSVIGDFRFIDNATGVEQTAFPSPVKVNMGITPADLALAPGGDINALFPIQTVLLPDGSYSPWKRLSTDTIEYTGSGAIFNVTTWGADPPTGIGTGGT